MLRVSVLFLLVLLCRCGQQSSDIVFGSYEDGFIRGKVNTNCTCGRKNLDISRIAGGYDSYMNKWPMMAGMIIRNVSGIPQNAFNCGGTIITSRHVLTAGHCLYYIAGERMFTENEISIILGAHNLLKFDYNNEDLVKTPNEIIFHPNFEVPATYDIAIIVLPEIKFSAAIGPICLPTKRLNITDKKLIVTGWGYTTRDGPESNVLQETKVIGLRYEQCDKEHENITGSPYNQKLHYQVCTYQNGTGMCVADSGGPLMLLDPDTNRYVLAAFVSYGTDKTDVNIDVSYFVPWIQHVISRTDSNQKTCAGAM